MSDATIANVVTAIVTITTMVVGFLTLWIKLKYGIAKSEEAATKVAVVEGKLDDNTALTKTAAVSANTAAVHAGAAVKKAVESDSEKMQVLHKIEQQTNGSAEALRHLIQTIAERVVKLEEYNRDGVHRVIDAVNAVHLKVAELVAVQKLLGPFQPASSDTAPRST